MTTDNNITRSVKFRFWSNPFVWRIYLRTSLNSEEVLSAVGRSVRNSWMDKNYRRSVYRNGFEIFKLYDRATLNWAPQSSMGTIYPKEGYSIVELRIYNSPGQIFVSAICFIFLGIESFVYISYHAMLDYGWLLFLLFLIVFTQFMYIWDTKKIFKVLVAELGAEVYTPAKEELT